MIKTLKQSITKLGLACTLALGCTAAATAATVLDESTEPTPAYADRWYQDPQDIISWYCLDNNGVPKTGWQKIGSSWYYFYSNGTMANGWVPIGTNYYYFGKGSGVMQTGWIKDPTGTWYYLGSDGAMKTGWQRIGGKWYYFNSSGTMVTGWQSIGGKWYRFGDLHTNVSGAMLTGWFADYLGDGLEGSWYYLDKSGAMVTGWNKVGSKWYYHNKSGEMLIGWQRIGGTWYHLNGSGAMDANKWVGNYYCKSDGSMATSQKIGHYHVGANGLWDGAEANTNPLHIETDFYELNLPDSWKDKVSYTTSGNRTYVYLANNKDCNLFIISANATTGGGRYSGSLDYTNFKIGETPSGASIYCTINNWPSMVASNFQHGFSYYSKADYSKLIQLQTNNTISYEQVEDNPEFYIANPIAYDYIKNEVLSTAVFHN